MLIQVGESRGTQSICRIHRETIYFFSPNPGHLGTPLILIVPLSAHPRKIATYYPILKENIESRQVNITLIFAKMIYVNVSLTIIYFVTFKLQTFPINWQQANRICDILPSWFQNTSAPRSWWDFSIPTNELEKYN